jgi:hypothetical protein
VGQGAPLCWDGNQALAVTNDGVVYVQSDSTIFEIDSATGNRTALSSNGGVNANVNIGLSRGLVVVPGVLPQCRDRVDNDGDGSVDFPFDGQCADSLGGFEDPRCMVSVDQDGDSILDGCDNCLAVSNGDQLDSDFDGVGDACDNCADDVNPDQLDTDSDGLGNLCDNCFTLRNPDQRDTDGDGCGNSCDADLNNDGLVNLLDLAGFRSRFLTTDPLADFDGSGLVNLPDLARLRALFLKPPGPSGITEACYPLGPPCSLTHVFPLIACGTAFCSDSPRDCVLNSCAAEIDALPASCESCATAAGGSTAPAYLDAVILECTE